MLLLALHHHHHLRISGVGGLAIIGLIAAFLMSRGGNDSASSG
jgi:hypothetical protein